MRDQPKSEARERVLHVAERLFSQRGYKAVTLRDIADELRIKPASLYNHAPGGKQDLFIAITERNLARHRAGIEDALAQAGGDLRSQFQAIARWLLSQPPTNLQRMQHSDMPALPREEAERLSWLAYQSLLEPILHAVRAAVQRGEIVEQRSSMLSGTFLVSIEGIRGLEERTGMTQEQMMEQVIDLLLDGARPR
jgi:TetR/AcrR family transcriptional regulator, cholesterol catabolism regulator